MLLSEAVEAVKHRMSTMSPTEKRASQEEAAFYLWMCALNYIPDFAVLDVDVLKPLMPRQVAKKRSRRRSRQR